MPEQRAWSAVSVWHNLHSPTPPLHSLTPSFLSSIFSFPTDSLSLLSSLNCYLFRFSSTHLLLPPTPPPCRAILFAHFILCSFHSCIALLGAITSIFFCLHTRTVLFPQLLLKLFILPYCFRRGGEKEGEKRKRWRQRKEKRASVREERGRRVKEQRLKAHYFPPDGRKWVRGQ